MVRILIIRLDICIFGFPNSDLLWKVANFQSPLVADWVALFVGRVACDSRYGFPQNLWSLCYPLLVHPDLDHFPLFSFLWFCDVVNAFFLHMHCAKCTKNCHLTQKMPHCVTVAKMPNSAMFAKESDCAELQKVHEIYKRWQIVQIWHCHCTELQKVATVHKIFKRWQIAQIWRKKSRSILQNLQKKIPHCATFAKVTTLRVIQRTASTTLRSLVCAKVKMAANILVFKLHNRSPRFKHRLASSSHEHNFQR